MAFEEFKSDDVVDAQIIEALEDTARWQGSRPVTGGGMFLVRSAELAYALSLDEKTVGDSLGRLEEKGWVRKSGGSLENPAPYWHILPR